MNVVREIESNLGETAPRHGWDGINRIPEPSLGQIHVARNLMEDISLFTFKREHLPPPETYAERCVGYQVRLILGSTPYLSKAAAWFATETGSVPSRRSNS